MAHKNQPKADKKWQAENREHSNYLKTRSAARSFIRNKAKLEDIEELAQLLEERKKVLKKG